MRDSGFPVGTRIYVCLHAEHHGLPVTFEITPGPVRPQTAQVRTGRGTHLPQSGPSGVRTCTGRRRPHSTQVSWLVGSVIRQCAHSGRPCSSRVAASRTAPHRPQGWARDFAVQSRHSHFPSIRLCRWTIRPQRGQGGGRSCSLRSRTGYRSAAARSCRGVGAGAGEQLGPVLQRPSKPKAVPGPRGRLPYGCGGDVRRQGRVGGDYHVEARSSGSHPPSGGHATQRGFPSRSRVWIGRIRPHSLQGSRTGPQTPQYQSSPVRAPVRPCGFALGMAAFTDPAGTASRPPRGQRSQPPLVERVDDVPNSVLISGDQPGSGQHPPSPRASPRVPPNRQVAHRQ